MTTDVVVSGLLTESARLEGVDGRVVIDLDLGPHAFLRDHLVGGRPLLCTVMGIESMACAVALTRPDRPVSTVSHIRVRPPYLLPGLGFGRVEATFPQGPPGVPAAPDGGLECELRSADPSSGESVLHYSGELAAHRYHLPVNSFRNVPGAEPGSPSVDGETVYRLFFHGPSFQVVGRSYYAGGLMVGVLRPDLPPAVHPRRPSIMAPLLIELCLQTAGLWELGVLRRMMIPNAIDRVTRFTDVDVDDGVPLVALVLPRPDSAGSFAFDAQVVDQDGRVHLDVQGYRTTGFGHPVDGTAALAIADRLAGIPAAYPC